MAIKKISEYDEVTSLGDDDVLIAYIVGTDVTRKLKKSNLFVDGAAFGARVDVTYANRAILSVLPNNTGAASSGELLVSNSAATAIGYVRTNDAAHTDSRWGLTVGGYTEVMTTGAASNGLVVGTATADPLIFGTANVERVRIDASGNMILATGADLYTAQGTYTPTVTGSGSNPTVTYGTRTGHYKKMGDVVFFTFNCPVATSSGGSGNIRINLPTGAPAYTGSAAAGGTSITMATVYDGAGFSWTITAGATVMTLYYAGTALSVATLDGVGGTLRGSGFYFI